MHNDINVKPAGAGGLFYAEILLPWTSGLAQLTM